MKPHEETWIVHPMDFRAVCELNAEDTSESLVVADIRADEPREVATLIAAAPEMARALLESGYIRNMGDGLWHTDVCNELNDGGASCGEACGRARAALMKAGALP